MVVGVGQIASLTGSESGNESPLAVEMHVLFLSLGTRWSDHAFDMR